MTFGDSPVESEDARTKVMPWIDWRALHIRWPCPSIDKHSSPGADSSSLPVFELVSGLVIAAMTFGTPCVDFEDLCCVLQGAGELTFKHWIAPAHEPVGIFL